MAVTWAAELLSPEYSAAPEAAANVKYVPKRDTVNLPDFSRVPEHHLLCITNCERSSLTEPKGFGSSTSPV
jgi:hypothetical protein